MRRHIDAMRVVLLIARYEEDLTWLEDFPDIPRDNLKVFRSDNVGREAETYVSYIVQNYEDLPDRIIFSPTCGAIPSNTLRSFRNSSWTFKPGRASNL